MYFKKIVMAGLCATLISTTGWAKDPDPKEQDLDAISVTATRLERKTSEVPASVSIAGEEEIKDTKMFNIKEALQSMPGVLIDSKNKGYDSRVIIRGSGLKARYGVRDVMVLMDGVPITDPDSLTRLDFIDTHLIEQVEVVKGPNSTLWGANAAGGTINIITKSPLKREGGVVKVGVGDYDTRSYHASLSSSIKDRLFYTLSGSRRETENSWRRWNEFESSQGSVQASYALSDGSVWDNHFGYTDASLQLPGKLDQAMFDDYKRTGRANQTEGPWQFSSRDSEIFFFSSKLTQTIGPFEWIPMVFFNHWTHHHPVTGRINDADTLTYGADVQVNYAHTLAGSKPGTLTFGVTARRDDQDTDYFKYAEFDTGFGGRISEVLSDKPGDKIETQNRKVDLYGIYAQESLRPSSRWIIDLGLRYDVVDFDISGTRTEDFNYGAGTYMPASDPADISKRYDDFSPRLGVTFKLSDRINLYATASKGIQTPTEGELSENSELDLVEVKNYEIGIKARYARWAFDAAYYDSPVENEVTQVIQEGGQSDYVNAGKTDKRGFEFSGSLFITPELEVGGSYSYTDYTFDDFSEPVRSGMTTVNVDRSGNALPFIPTHQYSLFCSYRHPIGLRGKVQTYSWGEYYIDNANSEEYEGYDFVTNVLVGYEKGPLDVSLIVENVFDQLYALEVQKDTRGTVRYSPAAPRSYVVRLTYKF